MHLENQFGSIELSHFPSLSDYYQSLNSTSVQLSAWGHPISDERLVIQLVDRLKNDDYKVVAALIQQSESLPSFDKACSMLELDRVSIENNKTQPNSSMVLLTETQNSKSHFHPSQHFSGHRNNHGRCFQRGRGNGGRRGHLGGRCRGRQQPQYHNNGN